eukprot:m.8425 g.8425  ORF g.8425 m.8425 type:complete len:1445 (+) comp5355_c0_seq1:141-4475(+)
MAEPKGASAKKARPGKKSAPDGKRSSGATGTKGKPKGNAKGKGKAKVKVEYVAGEPGAVNPIPKAQRNHLRKEEASKAKEAKAAEQTAQDATGAPVAASSSASSSNPLLKCFWELAAPQESIRIDATVKLIAIVAHSQQEAEDDELCSNGKYALQRLMRGVASNRDGARQGFSTALCQLLRTFEQQVDVDELLTSILTTTAIDAHKHADAREFETGRIFAIGAIVRSKVLASQPEVLSKHIEAIMSLFFSLAKRFSFHSDLVAGVLADLVQQVDSTTFEKYLFVHLKSHLMGTSSDGSVGAKRVKDAGSAEGATELDQGEEESEATVSGFDLCLSMASATHLRSMLSRAQSSTKKSKKGAKRKSKGGEAAAAEAEGSSPFTPEEAQLTQDRLALCALTSKASVAASSLLNVAATHPVWFSVVGVWAEMSDADFKNSWTAIVSDGLLEVESSTNGRRAVALDVTRRAALVMPQRVSMMLDRAVIDCFARALSSTASPLQGPAKFLLNSLLRQAQKDSDQESMSTFRLSLVTALTGDGGALRFDSRSKTNFVQVILRTLTLDEVKQHTQNLLQQFEMAANVVDDGDDVEDEEETEQASNIDTMQSFVISQLQSMLKNGQLVKDEEWLKSVTLFHAIHAFFDTTQQPPKAIKVMSKSCSGLQVSAPLSQKVKDLIRDKFSVALNEVTSSPPLNQKEKSRKKSLVGCTADGTPRVALIVQDLFSFMDAGAKIDRQSKDVSTALAQLQAMLQLVEQNVSPAGEAAEESESADPATQISKAFQLLALQCVVLMLESPDQVVGVISDLKLAYEALMQQHAAPPTQKTPSKKKGKKQVEVEADGDEDKPEPTGVVIDILLNLLSQSSAVLRTTANRVFEMLCPFIPTDSLSLLLNVLSESNPLTGANGEAGDMSDSDDEEEDDIDDEQAEEGSKGKVESKGTANTGSGSDSVSESEDESDDESESDDSQGEGDDQDTMDPELRKKMAEALGVKSDSDNEESDGEAESDSDESDWDNDRMFMIDTQIGNYLRLHLQRRKQKQRGALTETTHFKMRVADLVSVFIKARAGQPIVAEVVGPILQALVSFSPKATEHQAKAYQDKLRSLLIKNLAKTKSISLSTSEEMDRVQQILIDAFQFIIKSKGPLIRDSAAIACDYLIRSLSLGETEVKKVDGEQVLGALHLNVFTELYGATLKTFLTDKKSDLKPDMFTRMIPKFPALGWSFVDVICESLSDAHNLFRQDAGISMLALLLQQKQFLAKSPEVLSASVNKILSTLLTISPEASDKAKAKNYRAYLQYITLFLNTMQRQSLEIDTGDDTVAKLTEVVTSLSQSQVAAQSPPVYSAAIQALKLLGKDTTNMSKPAFKPVKPVPKEAKPETKTNGQPEAASADVNGKDSVDATAADGKRKQSTGKGQGKGKTGAKGKDKAKAKAQQRKGVGAQKPKKVKAGAARA